MSEPTYRPISDDEFLGVIRGRPSAPTLYVREDEAAHYHKTMDEAYPTPNLHKPTAVHHTFYTPLNHALCKPGCAVIGAHRTPIDCEVKP